MADKIKRTKTKYPCIYFNENSQKYDVKYNYKEYDPVSGKNKYKAKWIYNLNTLTEAKKELSNLQAGLTKEADQDASLMDVFNIWKQEAEVDNFSKITIRNTEQQIKMIDQFVPLTTKMKNINEETYNYLISCCRKKGYSEETLHNINACFRKLIRVAYRKDLLKINILEKMKKKTFKVNLPIEEFSDKIVLENEFKAIDEYFEKNTFVRLGFDRYKKFRLLFNFLYFSGCRIGEVLPLTYRDFEMVAYDGNMITLDHETADRMIFQVQINKVMLSDTHNTIRYETKNKKNRVIPLPDSFAELYAQYMVYLAEQGIVVSDDFRIFDFGQGTALCMLKKAIKATGIRDHSLHDFRHTFISNLLSSGLSLAEVEQFSGDTQRTIFERYNHANADAKENLVEVQTKLAKNIEIKKKMYDR